jgi:hypothetical protein
MRPKTASLFSTLCVGLSLLTSACSKENVAPTPTAKNGVADATVLGPFTTNATLTRVQTNQKIFLNADPSRSFAAGVYICDIYSSSTSVTLTSGQFMLYDNDKGPSKPGYTSPTSNTIGSSSIQSSGNVYTFTTYSVLPRYDSIGRAVGGSAFPQDLTGNTYTYSVYQP